MGAAARAETLMEYLVRHRTTYRYLQDVSYSYHLAHLRPRESAVPGVLSTALAITPDAGRPRRRARIISATAANGSRSTSRIACSKSCPRAGCGSPRRRGATSRPSASWEAVRARRRACRGRRRARRGAVYFRFAAYRVQKRRRRLCGGELSRRAGRSLAARSISCTASTAISATTRP